MLHDPYSTKYKDIRLFLWMIPAINVLTYYLTYSSYGPLWRLVVTFTIDTLEGYIAWWLVRWIMMWLDTKIPYEPRPLRRIVIQLLLTLLAGSLAIILLTEGVNWLATSSPVPRSFYTKDIFIISIWFFVVNGIYIGLHYYGQWQEAVQSRRTEAAVQTGGFKVSTPRKDLLFAFGEIGGFYIDGDYSVVVTLEKTKYFVDTSLDKVEKKLPAALFFRLNRQYIVHRQLVSGFEKGENGKINVLLRDTDHLPPAIPVSRTRAPGFKLWFVPA